MIRKIIYFSILLFMIPSCTSNSKTNSPTLGIDKINNIDNLANRYLQLGRFSGVILVNQNGSTLYNSNFGLADYENNTHFSDQSAFKIGTISELITANIITNLVEKGSLELTNKVSKYIPEIISDLTINDFLKHETNFPTIQQIQRQNPSTKYSIIDFANVATASSKFAERSDLNYNILGMIIEKISNKSFQKNLEQYSQNLDLKNTYYHKIDSNLAVGYTFNNQGNGLELQKSILTNQEKTHTSNGLKSTALDLAKIISSSASSNIETDGYIQDDGFSFSLDYNHKTKTSIIILSNRKHPVPKEMSNSIIKILENNDYSLPLARIPFDIEQSLLKDYAGSYDLNENIKLAVITENDSLFVMMGSDKTHLIPQSPSQFYMEQMDASIRFLRDTNDEVNEIVLLDGFLDGNTIKRTVE